MEYLKKKFLVPVENPRYEEIFGCVEWTGCKDGHGYGLRRYQGRLVRSHRVAWIEANGPVPTGMCVCHRCDNPSCVKVDHLFLGTPADNAHDRDAKGRRRGPRMQTLPHKTISPPAPRAAFYQWSPRKLTLQKVEEIRAQLRAGMLQRDVARCHGVSQSMISVINTRRNWR